MKTKFAHSNFRRDKTLSLTIGDEAEHIFFLIYIKSVWELRESTSHTKNKPTVRESELCG